MRRFLCASVVTPTLRVSAFAVSTRRSSEHFLSIAERHCCGIQKVGTVFCQRTIDGYDFADLERIPSPSAPEQHGRSSQLDFPVHDLAGRVFRIDEKPRVRIDPIDFRDGPVESRGLAPIVLRGEGMMRKSHARRNGERKENECGCGNKSTVPSHSHLAPT